MEKKQFKVGEALRWGFKTFYSQLKFFLLLTVLYFGLVIGFSMLLTLCSNMSVLSNPENIFWTRFIHFLAVGCVMIWLQLGLFRIMLDVYDYGKAEIKTLFSQTPLFLRVLFALILLSLSIMLCDSIKELMGIAISMLWIILMFWIIPGFYFWIIPALYLMCRYIFIFNVLVDKKVGIVDAFKESACLSAGVRRRILGLLLISIPIAIIPFLFVPAGLAFVYAYRKQQENTLQLPTVQ